MIKQALQEKPSQTENENFEKCVPSTKTVIISKEDFDAVLFDMDGVVTRTASVHAEAWKQAFDQFLKQHRPSGSKDFDKDKEYRRYVDGKPRYEGVESFLKSRHIILPHGDPSDAAGFNTICAIGNLKNQIFLKELQEHHVQPYETTVALIQSLKREGIKVAIITASENGAAVLQAANLVHVFDASVDGVDAKHLNLKGKPQPDTFLQAAKELGVRPARAIVVEDAAAGVEAGSKGKFGLVIGVNRDHNADLLKQHGANVVVRDLAEVGLPAEAAKLPGMAVSDLKISDKNWVVRYDQFDAKLEKRREALCSLGNGYFTSRASAPESQANDIHCPGIYCAGLYNRLKTEVDGKQLEHEDLVNLPNLLALTFKIEDDVWFELEKVQILSYQQNLALHEGILYRQIRFKDDKGRETSIAERRFVHMRHFHLAGIESKLIAHNWSGILTIRSSLDGRVLNATAGYSFSEADRKHLQTIETSIADDLIYLKTQTIQSQISISQAARTTVLTNGQPLSIERKDIRENDYVGQDIKIHVTEGDEITIEKVTSLFTSRDQAISEAGLATRRAIIDAPPFADLIDDQIEEWRHLWERFDLSLETREDTPKIQPSLLLHLNSFQALSTISKNSIDLDIGIPARGWSEGYHGHIFWDDINVYPFLNLHVPLIARAMLKYRYKRLDAARKLAKDMGMPGARFPWQSGSTGREETPLGGWDEKKQRWNPDNSHLQIHVNAAISLNLWKYYQATGDLEFMYSYGAEILFEIARFFAHFAKYNFKRRRYEINGVVGPDEFHVRYPDAEAPGINNNAYTNLMAVWTLARALELMEILPEIQCNEICQRLKINDDELKLWEKVSRKMFIPFQDDGIIIQFEGYDKLQKFPCRSDGFIDLDKFKQAMIEENGLPYRYQVSKQADVLLLFYLFSAEELKELFDRLEYSFCTESIPDNIKYYVKQTANYSSLSRVAVAWVLSRMDRLHAWKHLHNVSSQKQPQVDEPGIFPSSWDIFQEALVTDFYDTQGGTTVDGLHTGAMVGTIDIVQRCYTGLVTKDDILWFNPCLPKELIRLSFRLQYRQQAVYFEITQHVARITAGQSSAASLKIGFNNRVHEIAAGKSKSFNLK